MEKKSRDKFPVKRVFGKLKRRMQMQSMGEVGPGTNLLVESPNMLQNMAENLLVTPPRLLEYEESETVEPLYSLWSD
ncbi:hypothetical protein SUGI_0906820 [Cryptomeria japonica]|nr:hypothetical protein SUGI_0906820 [Cryptomeria japonica]